jgi:outer membrane protein assembly factor BamA
MTDVLRKILTTRTSLNGNLFLQTLSGKPVLFLFMILFIGSQGFSQQVPPKGLSQNTLNPVDLIDVVRDVLGKTEPARNDSIVPGVGNLSLLPIIGYGPANGFVIGAAVSVTKLLGDPKTTQLSSALMSLSLTTKDQVLLCLRTALYLPENKWYIPGDVRLLLFTQPTYGLGIYGLNSSVGFNIGGINVDRPILEQPMKFNYIRFYESALKEVAPHWYAGLGIYIDVHDKIEDESLKLDTPNLFITSNYFYSVKYGFNPVHYSTNGLAINILHDSRDNPINAYKGYYANLRFRVNEEFLGSTQNSTMLFYDLRTYLPLRKSKPGNVLAFWTWGEFVTSGNVPYLALPSIGWDTYGRSGRGYVQGRFRGVNMMYGEAEYRLPLSRNGLFGMVAFLNATTASSPTSGQLLFESLAPGYGVGLRINMNKKDRTNICVDYGRGRSSSGIYFNIQETF